MKVQIVLWRLVYRFGLSEPLTLQNLRKEKADILLTFHQTVGCFHLLWSSVNTLGHYNIRQPLARALALLGCYAV